MNANRVRLGGLLVAAFFLSLTGAFLAWHLAFPSDGARLEPGEQAWRSDGVIVTPLVERLNRLRRGDVVIAVAGRSMEAWARAIFQRGVPRPNWLSRQVPVYTVIRNGQRVELSVPSTPYPLAAILAKNWSTLLFTFFTQLVMTGVFLIKPNDRGARALFLWAWSLSHTYTWSLGLQVSDIVGGLGFWLYQASSSGAWFVFWSAGLEFAMVFPRNHPLLPKRPWLVPLVYLSSFAMFFVYLAITRATSPTMLDWLGRWIIGNWLVALIFQSLTAYVIWGRYRSNPDFASRRKIRWLVFALIFCGGIGLSLWFIPGVILGHTLIDANALGLSLLPFPVILAIAVLRYQLFDIDILIRRTLQYSVLSGLLALIYFGSVVLVQSLFRALTGQSQNQLVTVVSTLALAALFAPLRRRVQDGIDRRFYRKKYDAAKVIAEFGATCRDETDLDKLTARLVEVVQETMQPESVTLWLKPTDDRRWATADGVGQRSAVGTQIED
jgi:hypothetical protein